MRLPLLFLAAATALADSNIDPAHSVVSDDLIGALLWRPGSTGAVISQYYCSGRIYSANAGWISLSSGAPANGAAFSNNSGADYGVNVLPNGDLSGYAYGANIGWINFSAAGKPHVDFATGKLSGSAWGANVGWIELGNAQEYLRLEALPDLPDSDGDGLPDAWELTVAGNLTALSGEADSDEDGQTDLQEYFSGTNPLEASDLLLAHLSVTAGGSQIQFGTKRGCIYQVEQRAAFGSGYWLPVNAERLVGTGAPASITIPPSPSNLFFYRVAAYPPLSNAP